MVFYVYALLDPRKRNTPFYIGKGSGGRIATTITPTGSKGSSLKRNVLGTIKRAGLKPIVQIIAKDIEESEAFRIEKLLIGILGRRHCDQLGILANVQAGGEGSAGYRWTDEQRQRASKARKGLQLHENTKAAIRKRNSELAWTNEMRTKVAAVHAGKVISDKHKAALSALHKGKTMTAEQRAKIATAHRGGTKAFTDEQRAAQAERLAKQRATGANQTPEAKAKRAASIRAYWDKRRSAA